MEKRAILLFFLILFVLSMNFSFALDIEFKKSEYFSGETLQAEISGNFIDNLNIDNIGIYKDNAVHKTPAESSIIKSENKYLYYAILPSETGNYQLRIENTRYLEGNIEKKEASKNFTIKQSNSSYLSFSPGFIYTSKDFELTIKAYNKEQAVNVEFSPANFKQSFSLGYGKEKTIYFSIAGIKNFTKSQIKINNYEIPAIISPLTNQTQELSNKTEDLDDIIALDTNEIKGTLKENTEYFFQILIAQRYGIDEKPDLTIESSSKDISISPKTITDFEDEETINITIKAKNSFNSSVKISSVNYSSIIIPVSIITTKNVSEVNYTTSTSNPETCSDFKGIKCNRGEKCSGYLKFATDGECCIGSCIKKESSKAWIWGIIIIIILGALGFFLYKKSQNPESKFKLEQIFRKKSEDYKERLHPEESKEVRKSLSKE
jgi:hypothetical protein